jgi:hypothetical protein
LTTGNILEGFLIDEKLSKIFLMVEIPTGLDDVKNEMNLFRCRFSIQRGITNYKGYKSIKFLKPAI